MTGTIHERRPCNGYPVGVYKRMRVVAKSLGAQRLKRIEGQVRGLARMVEDDRYCIDVITQLSAARVAYAAPRRDCGRPRPHCVEHAITSGNKAEQRRKVSELIDVISRSDR